MVWSGGRRLGGGRPAGGGQLARETEQKAVRVVAETPESERDGAGVTVCWQGPAR